MPALEDVGQSCRGSAKRQPELLVVSETETSAYPHSPITSVALTPLAPLPAILSQADSFSESSMRLDQLVLKPPDNGGPRRRLYDTVSVSFTPSVTPRSPEFEMGFNPVSQPGHVWANPTSHSSSLELVWWERIKPPNKVAYRRLLYEAVNTLNKRAYSVTHLGWNATTPPSFPVFLVSVALASYCGSWTLDVASSSFTRCRLWTAQLVGSRAN